MPAAPARDHGVARLWARRVELAHEPEQGGAREAPRPRAGSSTAPSTRATARTRSARSAMAPTAACTAARAASSQDCVASVASPGTRVQSARIVSGAPFTKTTGRPSRACSVAMRRRAGSKGSSRVRGRRFRSSSTATPAFGGEHEQRRLGRIPHRAPTRIGVIGQRQRGVVARGDRLGQRAQPPVVLGGAPARRRAGAVLPRELTLRRVARAGDREEAARGRAFGQPEAGDRHLIGGERAGLVAADDARRSEGLDGGEPPHDRAAPGHALDARRERDRHGDGETFRDESPPSG